MSGHNNTIPNGHFHKDWQRYIKMWFNQPMKKVRRKEVRRRKSFAKIPRPMDLLRPIVRCPSVRYHTKQRIGKGFSFQELKSAGINRHYAQTIGIAVDHRRYNKSHDGMLVNKQRLKEYLSKLIIYPLNKKKEEQPPKIAHTVGKGLNKLIVQKRRYKARVPTEEEKKVNCYITLRLALGESRRLSRKLKRNKSKDLLVDVKH